MLIYVLCQRHASAEENRNDVVGSASFSKRPQRVAYIASLSETESNIRGHKTVGWVF